MNHTNHHSIFFFAFSASSVAISEVFSAPSFTISVAFSAPSFAIVAVSPSAAGLEQKKPYVFEAAVKGGDIQKQFE